MEKKKEKKNCIDVVAGQTEGENARLTEPLLSRASSWWRAGRRLWRSGCIIGDFWIDNPSSYSRFLPCNNNNNNSPAGRDGEGDLCSTTGRVQHENIQNRRIIKLIINSPMRWAFPLLFALILCHAPCGHALPPPYYIYWRLWYVWGGFAALTGPPTLTRHWIMWSPLLPLSSLILHSVRSM